jgi:dienelactone hydrolase
VLIGMINLWNRLLIAFAASIRSKRHDRTRRGSPDAWGALLYLSKLAFIDPERVAIAGWSQGGRVALEIASAYPFELFEIPDNLQFKAAVAYYPPCRVATDQMSMPTLVLIGELDDWTPATDCERWLERNAGKGAGVKLVIYPGAFHGFDASSLGEGKRSFGHWLKYDPDADERSKTEMRNFLAIQLGAR